MNMKPLVYQIIIGDVPPFLRKCISSVVSYANRNDYNYRCDTELPSWAADLGMRPREASEWMRAEMLSSRPYVLWVDWDIIIYKDFELGEDILTVPSIDSLLYYGSNVDLAKKVLIEMGNKEDHLDEFAIDCYAFQRVYKGDISSLYVPNSYIWHYCYTLSMDFNRKSIDFNTQ